MTLQTTCDVACKYHLIDSERSAEIVAFSSERKLSAQEHISVNSMAIEAFKHFQQLKALQTTKASLRIHVGMDAVNFS